MPHFRYSSILIFVLFFSGCTALQQQSLKGPGWYMVKPTDTLYSIAWRYALDFEELAQWNGIAEPYVINPGQQITLIKPDQLPITIETETEERDTAQLKQPVVIKPLTESYNQAIRWQWPVKGEVLNHFSIADLDRRGIDIAGEIGQPVFAVADGKVVYSGTGLADYGNLIIVKHDNTYLSAYAYNNNRLVQEGMQVKMGTHIADMGAGKNNKPMLHFQVRRKGKPVDPLLYLPNL